MNTLELKASIYDVIAQIEDRNFLNEVYTSLINKINFGTKDPWDELSPEQQAELDKAIEASMNDKNLIPHEIVMEKYKKLDC